ncbi:hypothetical protein FB446DRAFT_704366 [Lentinula raphanica]|nr:hypothetical protein FB446DRAFT_704366 [Lentinula raphanica]
MARRSHRALHVLYASRQWRSTSLADGPGYLYAFCDNAHRWKRMPMRWSNLEGSNCCNEAAKSRLQDSSGDLHIQCQPEINMEEYYSTVASRGCDGVSETDNDIKFLNARTRITRSNTIEQE